MDSTAKDIKDNLPAEIERGEADRHEIEETNYETYSIRESVIKNCSSVSDQSESDGPKAENETNSKSLICVSNTKIENLSEKEAINDDKESSKIEEIEDTFSKCKEVPLDTPISSPVKRKSHQTAGDEIKRKRSIVNTKIEARNDEISTCSLNVQDALCIGISEKPEIHLESTMVSNDNTTGEGIEEQDVAINQTDKSTIKCKIIKTTDETDSVNTNKYEISNTRKSSESGPSEETLAQGEMRGSQRRHPRVIPVEDFENDPEFVRQNQILETTHHQQSLTDMKPESDDKGKVPKSFKNKDLKVKMDNSDKDNLLEEDETEHPEIQERKTCSEKELMIDTPVRSPVKRKSESCFEIKPKRSTDLGDESGEDSTEVGLILPTDDCYEEAVKQTTLLERVDIFVDDLEKDMEKLSQPEGYHILSQYRKMIDEDPKLLTNDPENEEQSAAEDPPKEVKDTRYLKKFYKQKKSAALPVDGAGDQASTCKIEPKTDNEENLIQIIGDEARIVSRSGEDIVHEESEDPNILLKDNYLLKEERETLEDKLSEISASASKNKISSMEAKKPTEVKKYVCQILSDDDVFKKPAPPARSPKLILRKNLESPNRSHSGSPKREVRQLQSPPKAIFQLEGLAARVLSTASSISYSPSSPSQPPRSPASPSQPPRSPASPSQPPRSPASPSQPPRSPASPSQPPRSPASPSRTKK